MGTAILHPQNCLGNRFRREIMTPGFKPRRHPNANLEGTNSSHGFPQSRRRKRSALGLQSNKPSRSEPMVAKLPSRNLVMGQVKILKRGETLAPAAKKTDRRGIYGRGTRSSRGGDLDLTLGSTDRLGPDPETVQEQLRVMDLKVGDGVYAGSAFFSSPPPSSLPVPGFLGINGKASTRPVSAGN
ncbi:hypothetical protein SLA2020_285620 [Shorea laevis]